jgi:hypothetical protein
MSRSSPHLNREEFARRGTTLYEDRIRPLVEPDHTGRIVAIDIESGAYEVADDAITASDRLLTEHPDAQTWFVRVGSPALHRIGTRGDAQE